MKQSLLILLLLITIRVMAPTDTATIVFEPQPCERVFTVREALKAIKIVEDGYKDNLNEPQAKGILQQYPIFVRDCNEILGFEKYTLNDRMIPERAIEMFWVYQKYYNPTFDIEIMARIQCAGPDGHRQDCSLEYWNLVKQELYKL